MTPKAYRIAFPRKFRLGTFLSLAISLSLLTPLAPAVVGAAGAGVPRAATRAALAVAPLISATKTDAFPDPDNDGKAVPGDTITYTVQINNGGTDAAGVVFGDTVDPNTTFVPGSVTTTPVAIDDAYAAVGNVRINVPAAQGVTSNDSDPDGDAVTAVPATTTSANNGDVTVNADGSFTYNPAPGFEGADTFTYTIAGASGPSNTATVTVNVAGMIWFIDDSAAAGGDGRLTTPFSSISAFDAGAADQQNDNIFLYGGDYTGGLALQSGQALIGEGATASLSAITGLTPPTYSEPLPSTGGANPVVVGPSGIAVATNNLIRGITIANAGGAAISGSNFGTLSVSETAINATAQALNLDSGQLNTTFQSISSDGSAAAAVRLANIAVGSTFSGGATTIGNRGATGIELDNVEGTIAFGATTVANQMGAGGYGVSVRDSGAAVSFASATISDANQTVAQVDTTPLDGIPDNDGDGDAIFLKNNTGSFSVGGGALTNCGNDCVDARESSNVTLTNVAISNPGVDVIAPTGLGAGGHGFYALNLTGTNGLSGGSVSAFNGNNRDGVLVTSNMFSQTFNVAGTLFQNATGSTGVRATAAGTANVTLNVGGATNNAATNVTFDNISGSAVNGTSADTSTLSLNVRNSTFQNSPINGKTNIEAGTLGTGHGSFNVLNNTFNNVYRTASTGIGLINLNGAGAVVGNTFSANVSGNTISNVGGGTSTCGGTGTLYCAGPLQAINIFVSAATNVSGTILVDGNSVTAAQQGGLLLDMANTGVGLSPIAAKVTNNTFGTNAARVGLGGGSVTILSGIRVVRRVDGSPAANVLVSGNTVRNGVGSAGNINNSPGILLRVQNAATLDVTATGNDVDTDTTATGNLAVAELRADTQTATSTSCVDVAGNTFAGGAGLITLAEVNGSLNVEQASAAALSTANGGATVATNNNATVTSPNFGVACAAPVASLWPNANGQHLASSTAAKSAQVFAYLSGARTAEAFEPMPGLDAWRSNSKLLGGLSFNYAASNVALGSGLTDTVVRPAREAAPAAPTFEAAAAMPAFSGETVTVNVGTLPAGKSMTITFQVTIDTPFNATQVSNQGTVSYTGGSVQTDDPATGAFGDPTVTPVGTPATISCPADINANTDPGQFSASVPFTVTAGGTPAPTVDCKVGATSITSPHTFPVGTTAVQCTATNGIGSPASCSFNVTVTDNQTPAISCPANVTANTAPGSCDAAVNTGTPAVSDNDPNVAVGGTRSDAQPLNAPYPKGTTTITWTATDTAGNSASCQQTVTVNDATAPVVTLNGSATMTVECHTSFTDPGATAADNCGGSPSVSVSGSVNVNAVGSYTLTYTATDASGNTGTATRTVNVVDTTAPVVTLNGANPLTVTQGSAFVDPGATATDSCAGSLPVSVSGSVNTGVIGTYTLTYTATDASGNTGTTTRTVFVVYSFTGFFSPVSNPPALNEVKAGQNVPLKFSLNGYKGLAIFAPGSPASQQVNCATNVPINVLEETDTPGNSTLTYDASSDRYQYNWKTEKSWAGTCRVLVVTLSDGSTHTANFKFK
ncbi:MAG TPA: PxKF domain-containing protein [Pyrinomonadaceae bacterium]